jgi:predicted peroxiredoxin
MNTTELKVKVFFTLKSTFGLSKEQAVKLIKEHFAAAINAGYYCARDIAQFCSDMRFGFLDEYIEKMRNCQYN